MFALSVILYNNTHPLALQQHNPKKFLQLKYKKHDSIVQQNVKMFIILALKHPKHNVIQII